MKNHEVRILEIKEREDGTADLKLELTNSFKEWFLKKENIEEWNEELFKKRFLSVLEREIGEE